MNVHSTHRASNSSANRFYTFSSTLMVIACAVMLSHAALANTLCVNPGGTGGCYAKINDAVAAASAGDTVKVNPGTYAEDVVIEKSISIVGDNRDNTTLDATGLSNGFYVDGLDHPGLSAVAISNFTVENANFEGILITNSSDVTVLHNRVNNNDKAFDPNTITCPGLPAFETAEGFDCGEGIHLSGAEHSIVSANIVESNAGGILVSDDTASAHDNVITSNKVDNNPYDCAITLASHPSYTGSNPFGISHNTIAANEAFNNGLATGEGAGVGIFDSVPGAANSGNVVIHNRLFDNGLPGVAMHSHTPGQDMSNNVIVKNAIWGNGADTDDAFTPGPTGINVFGVSPALGTIVTENSITNEAIDVATNTPAIVNVHLNNLLGGQMGLVNLGSGTVDATENYWGCFGGPGTAGCSAVGGSGVTFIPFLFKVY